MAIFDSFGHCLPNILHTWPHDSIQVIRLSMTLAYFKVIGLFHIKFLKNGVWYGKSYYRLLIGNHTLAFDWSYFWWSWSTVEGHFSLGCHFHVHFSNPWHAFASHGLPAIAELLVTVRRCVWPTISKSVGDSLGSNGPPLGNGIWSANLMVTWSITSPDLERSRSWPQYVWAMSKIAQGTDSVIGPNGASESTT